MELIIIENLQVWPKYLGEMTWDDAMQTAKNLGEDWRLPTIEEFKNILNPNKTKIPELKNEVSIGVTQRTTLYLHGASPTVVGMNTPSLSISHTMCRQFETLLEK